MIENFVSLIGFVNWSHISVVDEADTMNDTSL